MPVLSSRRARGVKTKKPGHDRPSLACYRAGRATQASTKRTARRITYVSWRHEISDGHWDRIKGQIWQQARPVFHSFTPRIVHTT